MKNTNVTVNVTNRTIVRSILWIVATILAWHFIGRTTHVLTLILISLFLAMALNPAVGWMSRRLRIRSRVQASAAAYVVIIGVIALLLSLIIPPLVNQTRDFIKTVPNTVNSFQNQDNKLSRAAKHYNLDTKLSQAASDFTSNYGNFGSTILDTGKRVFGAIVSVIVVIVMTFMMLVEGPKWFELVWGNLPNNNKARDRKTILRIYKAVSGFVQGQLILAVVAGFFSFIALEIGSHWFNVSVSPLALAGIVTMFGIIPLFGNLVAATIVSLICLLSSWQMAAFMAIYFVIYFFIENHTFQPYLQSRLNELTPLTVFIAALLGVEVAGFLGAVVAIPVASAVKILLEEHFRELSGKTTTPTDDLRASI